MLIMATSLHGWGREKTLKFRKELQSCKNDLEILRDKQAANNVLRFEELKNKMVSLLVQ